MSLSDDTSTPEQPGQPRRRRIRLPLVLVLAVLALGAIGGFVSQVAAHGGMGWHRGGWSDPARVDDHVERMVKHLAIEIDATDDQRGKLTTLAQAAARDLLPLREKARAAREQAVALLTAPAIDRPAIERLRAEQVQAMDQASARASRLLADAAEVLTVEQRKELAERAAEHREHRRR